jgi:hypothetical protein
MYYNPHIMLHEGDDYQTRSYIEVPIHFLESIGIKDKSLVRLTVDQESKSIIIKQIE